MRKSAFTLLELIFVIVVIGILSAIFIPKFSSNKLSQAANQVISHIRYTQHLAMMDDKFNPVDSTWYKSRWQLLFGQSSAGTLNTGGYYAYSIFSDAGTKSGNPDPKEIAKNPLNSSKVLSGGFSNTLDWENTQATEEMNIGYKYGIDNVTQSGCSAKRISFDHLGRPLKGNSSSWTSSISGVLTTKCTITLHKGTDSIGIVIEPETGYVHLL